MVPPKKGARAKGIASATEQDDEPFSDEILYTKTEIMKMQDAVQNLAGAFGFKTVHRVHDIYRTYPNSKALIDEYLELRRTKYGWTRTDTDRSEPRLRKDYIYDWIKKSVFLERLQDDMAPKLNELPETCALRDQANFITMWYAFALMKCNPSMYPATKAQLDKDRAKIDPYDAVHAVAVLILFHNHVAASTENNAGNGIRGQKTLTARLPIPPKCGPSGCLGKDKIAKEVVDVAQQNKALKNYYFGPFPLSDRDVIVSALENPLGPFATDDMVRRITDKIGKVTIGIGEVQAPPAMDPVQVQILLDKMVDDDFLEGNLIFERDAMTADPEETGAHDLALTQLMATAENVVSFHEHGREKTGDKLDLGIQESESSMCRTHDLKRLSATSWPLQEACEYADIPIIDGRALLRPVDDTKRTTTILQPWQSSAIAWLMRQLDSPLHGGVLADACGLGKTLTSLCLLYILLHSAPDSAQQGCC